jgi:Required for nuclear transport of RNA pol II C-terminus 1
VDIGISTLITLLQDSDSYVYLCALTAISKLADLPNSRGAVFRALLDAFSNSNEESSFTGDGENLGSGSSSSGKDRVVEETAHVLLSPRHRALVGEALATVLRRAGDAAPSLVPLLVPSCIRVARARPSAEDSRLVESLVNLRAMTMTRSADDATSEDGGEIKSSTRDKPVGDASLAALAGDRALLRQSAMSLLAEAVVCAGWSASKYLIDILDIAAGVLSMEGVAHTTQTSSSVRRYLYLQVFLYIILTFDFTFLPHPLTIHLHRYRSIRLNQICCLPSAACA